MIVTLPWPYRGLHPNERMDRRAVASTRRRYRHDCALMAKAGGARKIEAKALHVTLTFCPPDNRLRDLDGMLAAAKSAIDGLADVLGVDDSTWSLTLRRADPVKGGQIAVAVEVVA